ncbi:DUF4912 domain-containing protein, partial [Limnospira sp. PMC 289.06]|nr:DUF4912 domain-containing protein [Limnospira sp. PMC 289.06]MDT9298132.1 DUF4912 domain-containing protein [Arthrospira platensis PCC 7345]
MAKERPPLEEMTLRQLRKVASEYSISRYSRMRKAQLLAAIQDIERQRFSSPSQSRTLEAKAEVEVAKFTLGQEEQTDDFLSSVDENLVELGSGYSESRVVMMARDPEWAYAYWDISSQQKEQFRRLGGQQLALRIYDVTGINLSNQSPHSVQEYPCDEMAREWYLPIPVSDRDYVIEIGYRCADGRWLAMARSQAVRIPPIYPSEWIDDQFITVSWGDELKGQTFAQLSPPGLSYGDRIYDDLFNLAKEAEAQRIAGSLFGSMHHVSSFQHGISSYIFPSGVGKWASGVGETMSGVGMSGVGLGVTQSGSALGYSMCVGMSGVGLGVTQSGSALGYSMSGVGMTESGSALGYSMSGVGMSGVGLGYSISGVGMSGVGLGITESGVGLGYSISGVGMSGVGLGYSISGVGMSGVGLGITESGVGLGYSISGVGMSGV